MTGVMIAAISVPVFADDGGAIYLDGGDPVVNTTFTDTTAGGNGGAIYFGAE